MTAYYNEIDPQAAAWLRELIKRGLIADGEVDERSIEDVAPVDLLGFTQCHFFAGIGGWSLALRLAGWPDDRPIWTGSCPCQPFSAAGKGDGFADERHLWPAFHWLIQQCQPPVVFGEQVASKHADAWVDLVCADLEALGYAFGAVPFPAAGVGAPHIRDRLYWMGHADVARLEGQRVRHQAEGGRIAATGSVAQAGEPVRLGHAHGERQSPQRSIRQRSKPQSEGGGDFGGMAHSDGWHASAERKQCGGEQRFQPEDGGRVQGGAAGPTNGHWRAADWLACRDGRWRPVEPGLKPLVDGLPRRMVRSRDPGAPIHPAEARVMRLRGYGNAIVPSAAAEFVRAFL